MVIALALLAGQRGTQAARWALFALPLAWLAGGLLGARVPGGANMPFWTTLSFGFAGVFVAFDARIRAAGVAGVAICAGLVPG
jgi:hypothetical protein